MNIAQLLEIRKTIYTIKKIQYITRYVFNLLNHSTLFS